MKILRLRMLMAGRHYYGFESQPTQVQRMDVTIPAYIQRLEALGFDRFVLLERKNYLRRFVSIKLARRTSRWHLQSTLR